MTNRLQEELVELRRMVLTMGAAVEQRLAMIVQSLTEGDFDSAVIVRHGDKEIDQMELEIEETCLRALALSHPVASDLRFVLAALRINADLERIGDLAKSVAKRIIAISECEQCSLPEGITKMATYARTMFADVLRSLAESDVRLARHIRTEDRRIDDLQKELFAWARREIPEHVEVTQVALEVLSMTRALERIGDHTTNIAEEVIFLVEGAVVRHGER